MSKELHIMHVSTPLTWRGGEQQVAYLASELRKLDVRQMLMVPEGSVMEKFCEEKGLSYESAPRISGLPLGFARKLAKTARKNKVKLLHAHDSHAHTACILAVVFFHLKIPIVLSRRVDFAVGNSWFSRFKYNHPQVKKILCVSKAIKSIMETCVERPDRLEVVYSGIDTSRFSAGSMGLLREEFSIHPTIPLIGNVAALADHKDYFTFVDTAWELNKANFEAVFFIIGDGPLREEIAAYVQEKDLDDRVIFTGFRDDITEVLPELDLLLFTSKTEGLGTTILDAWCAEVPVVATAAGGIPELIAHGRTGMLAPVGDAAACSEAVKEVLSNPVLKQEIIAEGKREAQKFSKEATAEHTLKIYRELANS